MLSSILCWYLVLPTEQEFHKHFFSPRLIPLPNILEVIQLKPRGPMAALWLGEGCLLHQHQAFRILEQMLKACAQLDLLNTNASVGCEADLGGDDLAGKNFCVKSWCWNQRCSLNKNVTSKSEGRGVGGPWDDSADEVWLRSAAWERWVTLDSMKKAREEASAGRFRAVVPNLSNTETP